MIDPGERAQLGYQDADVGILASACLFDRDPVVQYREVDNPLLRKQRAGKGTRAVITVGSRFCDDNTLAVRPCQTLLQRALIDAGDKATYALAHALHTTHRVDQATFDAAVTQFGEQGVAELVSLCGFYSLVSMTLNTFDVDLPAGASLPFPR